MNVRNRLRIGAVLLVLFFAASALFGVELSTDNSAVQTDRVIGEDFLFLGETLGFAGRAQSLYFFGETLGMSGQTDGNLFAAGANVAVDGSVASDAILAGRYVSITGALGSTTFAAGESVTIARGARVDGALFVGAGTLNIAGEVGDDVYAGARKVIISGRIDGDVRVGAADITIHEGAEITGDFVYDAPREISDNERSRIAGTIRYENPEAKNDGEISRKWMWAGKWIVRIIATLSILLFALLFYLFPAARSVDADRGHARFWRTVAWGLIPFFAYPIAIAALFAAGIAFGITIPIALSLAGALGVLFFVLYAFALPQIGAYVSRVLGWEVAPRGERAVFVHILLGIAVVFLLGVIPVVNGVAFVVALSLGWGVLLEKLFYVSIGGGANARSGPSRP